MLYMFYQKSDTHKNDMFTILALPHRHDPKVSSYAIHREYGIGKKTNMYTERERERVGYNMADPGPQKQFGCLTFS